MHGRSCLCCHYDAVDNTYVILYCKSGLEQVVSVIPLLPYRLKIFNIIVYPLVGSST
jgi:hypothetical protein